MARHCHFFMFVACEQTWQKQACIKLKGPKLHSNILQELGNIMYDREGPSGVSVEMWVMNRQYIINKYLATKCLLEIHGRKLVT